MRTASKIRRTIVAYIGMATGLTPASSIACKSLDAQSVPEIVVSAKPLRTLADDGSEERQFVNPRVVRLLNGDWIVADNRSKSIRLFPRGDGVSRLLARGGNGPGELPGAFEMQVDGDTIYTFGIPPMSPSEIRLYTSDKGFVRTIPARVEGQPRMTVIGRLNATTYLVKRGIGGMVLDRAPKEGIVFADSSTYGVFVLPTASTASKVTWMPTAQTGWNFTYPFKGSPVVPTSFDRYPFGNTTTVLSSRERIYEIALGSGEINVIDAAGRRASSARLSLKRVPFEAKQLEAARSAELKPARRGNDTSRIAAKYSKAILPEHAPLLLRAIAGDQGEVWIELFDLSTEAARRFIILNRDGKEIARATLPSNFEAQHIGHDFVLGVLAHESGDVALAEYSLRRPK